MSARVAFVGLGAARVGLAGSSASASASASAIGIGIGIGIGRGAVVMRAAPLHTRAAQALPRLRLRLGAPRRGVQTQSFPPTAAEEVLNSQRQRRPNSPHFTIYQPQLTWLGSIANRVTGTGLSVLLYGFSIAYLAAPLVGFPFSSADVVALVALLPTAVKYAGKVVLAAPFAYHTFAGVRHLAWDMTKFMTVKGMYVTGYAAITATVVSTVALVLL